MSASVAVVGGGVAGLTAARACAERGLKTVVYERFAPGGQLINLGAVTAWPEPAATGPDLAGALLEAAMSAGVEVSYGEVGGLSTGSSVTLETPDGSSDVDAVVVATGLTAGRLDVACGWAGRGLSTCASCDGPLHAGRDVVVVGGGEWAAHEALELAAVAARVTVVVPGTAHWSASVGARLDDATTVRTGVDVVGLDGESALTAVRLSDGTAVPASGVFVYDGATPQRGLLDAADGDARVVAAGDVVAGGATPYALTAAADGLRAGLAVADRLTRGAR